MKLVLKDDLPFVSVIIAYQGMRLEAPNILIDTGSATTIFSADIVASIGIFPLPGDILHTIRGVGGIEVVFRRALDYLQLGDFRVFECEIDIGGMDYGFEMNGILGMNALMRAEALIDLRDKEIGFQRNSR